MAFPITDAQLKDVLAGSLKTPAAKITAAAVWEQIITDSNTAAQADIVGALADRGYNPAQTAAWDRAEEFNRDLGLFWCLVKGAGLHGNDPTFINKLDRRPELAKIAVLIGGAVVTPLGVGEVGFGVLDTDDDAFTKDMQW